MYLRQSMVTQPRRRAIMFRRDHLSVWIGIIIMCSFYLMGQGWVPSSGGCLHVIDAENNDIGIYLGSSSSGNPEGNEIFVPSLELSFNFNTWTGELSANQFSWGLCYESTDCTGDFYSQTISPYSSFDFIAGKPGVYAVTAVGIRTIRSCISIDGCCFSDFEPYEEQVGISFKTVAVPSFPAPLRLEAR